MTPASRTTGTIGTPPRNHLGKIGRNAARAREQLLQVLEHILLGHDVALFVSL